MKKKTKGMNTRALKRKMGIDQKQMDSMLQDIRHLLEGDVFKQMGDEKEVVTIHKTKLLSSLEIQMKRLEEEWSTFKGEPKENGSKSTPPQKSIKINIS